MRCEEATRRIKFLGEQVKSSGLAMSTDAAYDRETALSFDELEVSTACDHSALAQQLASAAHRTLARLPRPCPLGSGGGMNE